MDEHEPAEHTGTDAVDVHIRLDRVVLAVSGRDGSAHAPLTPRAARRVADSLREAADAAERTPGG